MKKVIILNATELGCQVIRSLAAHGIKSIVLYDKEKDEIGRYSKHVLEAVKIPGFIEKPELLLEFLLGRKKEWTGTLIIPTKDFTVEFLARHRSLLSPHYIIPTPDESVIQGIVNKKPLYETAQTIGVHVPGVFSPRSPEELEVLRGRVKFPCLIKPGLGHKFFRKYDFKMIQVEDYEELAKQYRRLTDDFTDDQFELMICEIIPGADSENMVQFVSYVDQSGQMLAWMTSRKLRQDPPRYGQGRVAMSECVRGIEDQSLALLRALNCYGFSEIEWKLDPRDGLYKLIEINPRYVFYMGLCTACGMNFPYIQYMDLVERQKVRIDSFQEDIFWIHLYKDVLHTLLNHRQETISLKDYMKPYLSRKTFAVLSFSDPMPFIQQWRQHLSAIVLRNRQESRES